MASEDTDRLVHAYLDRELSAAESAAFEARLATDAPLRVELARLRELSEQIRGHGRYFDAPPALRARLAPESEARAAVTVAPLALAALARRRWLTAGLMGAAAGGCAVAGVGYWFIAGNTLRDQIIDAHVRATLDNRLIDVASSDQHTVKPWLSARLAFSPTVPDLSDQGFELTGARLDYIDQQPVAALVYRRRQHVITSFVWPQSGQTPRAVHDERGFHVVRFAAGGMVYWIVSDLNRSELDDFARVLASRV